ncbi:MAG: cysteine hydrolase [Hoeflea sp.]|uniref:cysteine hydrolase n=1 Tax=Hoeflea sp. TaxID=1940281 RepID=UPI001D56E649|nr:cysteine hydrolase [Hoeflea sp.]MBU4530734.1 cysteine hydrolase [Alphaproteobacteria bacterium]MBU4544733.1 cysteine hydrolase [Alphaproteobacteria bacterium]MBU4549289.1 cysteine hydrolase [Alphaproteobacteria bacterium]MBV1726328.1 cysteine hydrolase [Hoeflea sp.]MBV1761670.1 cysteine hydrolase [Hoeflea sp.]
MCGHDNHSHCHHEEIEPEGLTRRRAILSAGIAATAALSVTLTAPPAEAAAKINDKYADPKEPALPASTMQLRKGETALVVVDPQIDFLSPEGVTWGVVGASVTEHNVVSNISKLFAAAKSTGLTVAVSPHYYYPTDHGWKFEGALEKLMHAIGMFDRKGALDLTDFRGSGADFMPEYKEYIEDNKTVIVSPHKVFGPETNDLVLQLRKRSVSQVILAGMSANLCIESHMRELLEQGFEVAVVKDATAAANLPEGDGYLAAITNFRYMANAVWSTEDALGRIAAAL